MTSSYVCIGVPYAVDTAGALYHRPAEIGQIAASGLAAGLDAPWLIVEPAFPTGADAQARLTTVNRALAEAITAHPDRLPLIFAADCMSALGAMHGVQALASNAPAVLWYDAHGDFNTPETSPSGYLGGMPLAMLVGRGEPGLPQALGLAPTAEGDVILSDARDLDPLEADALRASAVTHLPDVRALLDHPLPAHPLYIHFDMDVLDPAAVPGFPYAAPGGPALETAAATLERAAREAEVAALLFSLWRADLADGSPAPLAAAQRLTRAFTTGLEARSNG